jgi:hypothetical protein
VEVKTVERRGLPPPQQGDTMLDTNRRSPPRFFFRLREGCAAVACLFFSGLFLACYSTTEVIADPRGVGRASRPVDADPYFAEQAGRKALAKVGYIPIMRLARQAGWVTVAEIERVSSRDPALLAMGGAGGFIEVFSKYAVAAGVASQADSPIPGPGDALAVGIVVIGLIDAGLLAGEILESLEDVMAPAAATAVPTATAAPIAPSKPRPDLEKDEECYEKCKHLLPSPSGDLQSSEYRKCYRECKGTL